MQNEPRALKCPRDGSQLHSEKDHAIEIDACASCKGAWYDFGELAELEATVAKDEDSRAGMIEYSKRDSTLACPVCAKTMLAFDYRGNNLELDACPDEHGFWLDAGESERVRELMRSRVGDLRRSSSAQQRWDRDREGGFQSGIIGRIRDLFRGGR
jgi:Zn-finger nucleic acid-binding protein